MSNTGKTWLIDVTVMVLITSLLYGLFLGLRPLTPPDEARYSEIPREMVVSKDYLTPHLDGVQYFEKPALFYWLQALSIKTFGLSEWSLRLMNALMGGLGVLMTYCISRKLYGRRVALLAGMLLSSALLYAFLSRYITLDITMTFFLTSCLLLFLLGNQYPSGRGRQLCMYGMYTAAGLATLTKGLIGIMFPGMIIFTWLLLTQQWRQLKSYHLLSGSVLFLIVTAPWHILVGLKNPGFFHFYFYEQHFLRYFTDYSGRSQSFWFLPLILLAGWLPWTGFMVMAIKRYLYVFKSAKQYASEVFLLIWSAIIFIFYWLSHSQLSPYILPIFPPLAIITACYLNEMWAQKNATLKKIFMITGITTVLSAVGVIIFLTKSHAVITTTTSIIVVLTAILSALGSNVAYRKYDLNKALVTLFITNFLFSVVAFYAVSFFNAGSTKTLALELRKMLRPGDVIHNYNHYFQDMPVYLEQPVTLVNWKGELEYGSLHNPPADRFLHENRLWDDWQKPDRQFIVMSIKDFKEIKSVFKNYCFYPIATTHKYVLICNKDTNK